MPQVAAHYKQEKDNGLGLMVILGENQYQGEPTLNYCKSYAQQHNVPIENIYIDYGDQYGGWEALFSVIYPYLADDGSFGLPWDAVLRGSNMEYFFASSGGPHPSVVEALEELLAP